MNNIGIGLGLIGIFVVGGISLYVGSMIAGAGWREGQQVQQKIKMRL
jgi:hypothetical protein